MLGVYFFTRPQYLETILEYMPNDCKFKGHKFYTSTGETKIYIQITGFKDNKEREKFFLEINDWRIEL